jgi:hypothetical protein
VDAGAPISAFSLLPVERGASRRSLARVGDHGEMRTLDLDPGVAAAPAAAGRRKHSKAPIVTADEWVLGMELGADVVNIPGGWRPIFHARGIIGVQADDAYCTLQVEHSYPSRGDVQIAREAPVRKRRGFFCLRRFFP